MPFEVFAALGEDVPKGGHICQWYEKKRGVFFDRTMRIFWEMDFFSGGKGERGKGMEKREYIWGR